MPPSHGGGPLKGKHFSNCPSENVPAIAAALDAARAGERERCVVVIRAYAGDLPAVSGPIIAAIRALKP